MRSENKKMEELFEKTLSDFLEQYMRDDTPEDEKIISYNEEMLGYSVNDKEEFLKVNIRFKVEPYSKASTIWNNNKENIYYLFAKYKNIDGEYELERVSMEPEYYEEFMVEFEKYQETLPKEELVTKVEQIGVQENYLENQEIQTISNVICIICAIILILSFCILVKLLKKR